MITDPFDWKSAAEWLGAVLMGVLAWLGKGLHRRQGIHTSELTRIRATYVAREELDSRMDELRDESRRRHEENTDKLDSIVQSTNATHRRIDDLYRDLLQAQRGTRK